ncbi:MAG: hypothetical protein ICV52_05385 [Microcoleus sp. C1-bin4]|nr:hypothetical protein [Microcoleus sp. C1-bin4]
MSRGLVSVFGCSHRRGLEAANLDRKIEIFSKPVTRLTELARSRSQDREIASKNLSPVKFQGANSRSARSWMFVVQSP